MVNGVNSFLVSKTSMEVYIFYLQSGAKIYIGRLEEDSTINIHQFEGVFKYNQSWLSIDIS